jgi:hypothetical protein
VFREFGILYYLTAPSINMIFYILVSVSFVVGLILMVSPSAYETFNTALRRNLVSKNASFQRLRMVNSMRSMIFARRIQRLREWCSVLFLSRFF